MKQEIDVLLATFNGEKYLEDFLNSLERQQNVVVNLIVSDDYSTDSTLDIIKEYSGGFNNFSLHRGPGVGPAGNFSFLLSKSSAPYFAFADQDDVWDVDHLIKSVRRLDEAQADFTSCPVKLMKNGNIIGIWPSKRFSPSLSANFFENQVRGCTIVATSNARELFLSYQPTGWIMHDWWYTLIALSCLNVVVADEAELNYRLHEDNFTTSQFSLLEKVGKLLTLKKSWAPHLQLRELLDAYQGHMKPEARFEVARVIQCLESSNLFRRTYFGNLRQRYRMSLIENFSLKVFLVLGIWKTTKKGAE
jgi:glycosyltransferase involved in cell wall biosynthesis